MKRSFVLIIGLMSLSMLGLIGLQVYWVRHALQVKEEQFDRSVNDALNRVVSQLEKNEVASVVKEHMQVQQQPQPKKEPETKSIPARQKPASSEKQKSSKNQENSSKTPVDDSNLKPVARVPQEKQYRFYSTLKTGDPEQAVVMIYADSLRKQTVFRTVVPLDSTPFVIRQNSDSLLQLIRRSQKHINRDSLLRQLRVASSIKQRELPQIVILDSLMKVQRMPFVRADTFTFRRGANISEFRTIKKEVAEANPIQKSAPKPEQLIKIKEKQVGRAMEQMVVELVNKEVSVRERINFKQVDSLVASALADKGIETAYVYAISNILQDSLLHISPQQARFAKHQPYYQVSLFPNDLVRKPDYLLLQFPEKQQYVLGSMWLMLFSSALFTLIILFTFGLTLFFIRRQKKISDIKTDFINNMTHEFKTPIATISLATDAIQSPKVMQDQTRIGYYTGIIKEENKRMLSQVEYVLQMALLDRKELQVNLEPIHLDHLILNTLNKIKLQVEQRNGKLIFNSETEHLQVLADKLQLENMFLNLLDNANKYSPENPEIKVSTGIRNGIITVAVADNGIGMAPDVQKYIFDKFYRVPTGNLHNVKGFGLGLSYVKEVIERHRGHIQVKSTPGKGSTFSITLPPYQP
ncbi:MAG: HAMP domain-containing histidine kinase [Hymenobacteraceae bacterium]|nr:HAMP domain-containing histidine kinase [Hymenobacteraceae bacterium]